MLGVQRSVTNVSIAAGGLQNAPDLMHVQPQATLRFFDNQPALK